MRKVKRWTDEELELLRKHYPLEGVAFCMEALSRTKSSVVFKAHELRIKSPPNKAKPWTHERYELELLERELDVVPLERYINAREPILHTCFEGHEWKVRPDSLLRGRSGCPKCAKYGFDVTSPAIFYYVRLQKDNQFYYKVGVTNNSTAMERLFREIDKSPKVLLEKHFNTGAEALEFEKAITKQNGKTPVEGILNGTGKTELYTTDIMGLDI